MPTPEDECSVDTPAREVGYARISTARQSPHIQLDAMLAAGVPADRIVIEAQSGADRSRPVLDRVLADLATGDRLTVWRLDRLGRSLPHLIGTLDELRRRGVEFRSLTESIDTATPAGRMIAVMIGAVAEFERDLIRERTAAGLAAARERGNSGGRPPSANAAQAGLVRRLASEGESHRRIAMATGLSRAGVGRLLRGEIATLSPTGQDDEPDGPGLEGHLTPSP
ncbi:MAG: recombinase family protein [Phycicoccus sp.]